MDSKETQQQQNRNAAAPLAGPTSTSQAMHNRSDLRQPQPQPDPLVLDGAPNSLPVQQPWMLLGVEQLARTRARAYAPPDGGDSGGGANAGPPARGGEEGSLTAHVININAGEDIAAKLVAFMNQEPRHVCVLSALGDVSIAELQSNNSLGLVKGVCTSRGICGVHRRLYYAACLRDHRHPIPHWAIPLSLTPPSFPGETDEQE
ncbi:hypothetical protein F2Q70_00020168 [Brassica cretica]|uniref:AT-hook motif nuclear-localized protein n=1 Tax=Brassica cretica TaxID=69181 RepID=A0A8S9GVD5_BRACR|nr:hypothetical protein F2Q70_00020168 [Brassica cretica]